MFTAAPCDLISSFIGVKIVLHKQWKNADAATFFLLSLKWKCVLPFSTYPELENCICQ